jgi:hypothetical protein
LVGWYWRVKTDVLGTNSVPLRHCRARICHDVDWDQTRAFWMLYWGPCPLEVIERNCSSSKPDIPSMFT